MKALVVSHTHHLLPLAWRLHQEGVEVELIVDRDTYERAWRGRFDSKLRNMEKRSWHTIRAIRQRAEEEGTTVLTDSPKWNEAFAGLPKLHGFVARPEEAPPLPPLTVGAWFTGETFAARHLLIEDLGLWPGGLGPMTPGGAVLVSPRLWPEAFDVALERTKDQLKSAGYRGLVKVGMAVGADRETGKIEPMLVGFQAGWNFLQTHALLAEAGDFGTPNISAILEGAAPGFVHRFTVVVPVSIPPYPHRAATATAADQLPIPPEAVKCGQVFWHDMMVEDGVVKTAGLDGLVGVVRASADSLLLARTKALGYARLIGLPELQVRVDVGETVERWLAMLEEGGVAV